jgi:hypothetical protein
VHNPINAPSRCDIAAAIHSYSRARSTTPPSRRHEVYFQAPVLPRATRDAYRNASEKERPLSDHYMLTAFMQQ